MVQFSDVLWFFAFFVALGLLHLIVAAVPVALLWLLGIQLTVKSWVVTYFVILAVIGAGAKYSEYKNLYKD